MPVSPHDPAELAFQLGALYLILVILAAVIVLWYRAAIAALAVILRAAYRRGWYRSGQSSTPHATRTNTHFDETFITFTRFLSLVSRYTPGDPKRHSIAIIVPLLVGLFPAMVLLAIVLFVAPMGLFVHVVSAEPGSMVLAFGSIAAYFGTLSLGWYVATRRSFPFVDIVRTRRGSRPRPTGADTGTDTGAHRRLARRAPVRRLAINCHYCDRPAAYAAESDGVNVGLCEWHFRERLAELDPDEIDAIDERVDIGRAG